MWKLGTLCFDVPPIKHPRQCTEPTNSQGVPHVEQAAHPSMHLTYVMILKNFIGADRWEKQ